MKKAALSIAALAAPLALFVLAGCPNPIDSSEAKQMLDKTAPVVRITSPAEGSTYSQTVTVQGAATDAGKVRAVAWQVSGTLGLLLSGGGLGDLAHSVGVGVHDGECGQEPDDRDQRSASDTAEVKPRMVSVVPHGLVTSAARE